MKLYHTTENWETFKYIKGNEQEECTKCKTIVTDGKDSRSDGSCQVAICKNCGHDEFYAFKDSES